MIGHYLKSWSFRFAILVILITSIPYLIAYERGGSGWEYTGFLIGVEDGNSYIAKMMRGAWGDWLFRSPYTAHSQNGFLGFLPYILSGKITSPPAQHEQLVTVYHLFRVLSIFFLVEVVYRFVSSLLHDEKYKRFCVVVCILGGGLGWIYFLGGEKLWQGDMPLEFYSPETFGFLAVLGLPHLVAARGLLLLSLLFFLSEDSKGWMKPGLFAGFSLWGVGIMQPLTILIGWFLFGLFIVVLYVAKRTRHLFVAEISISTRVYRGILGVFISSPLVIYTGLSFQFDAYLSEWAKQNLIFSPHPIAYGLAYGLFITIVLIFFDVFRKSNAILAWFLLAWFVCFPVLAYFPYPLQRRLPEGLWIGLATLAFWVLEKKFPKNTFVLFISTVISLLSPTIILAGCIINVWNPGKPLFRPEDEVNVFEYLQEAASANQIVLASYDTSNALPAWTPQFVLIGHGPESIHLRDLQPEVENFLSGKLNNDEAVKLATRFSIDFIIIEKKPERVDLEQVYSALHFLPEYSNSSYQLFRIIY